MDSSVCNLLIDTVNTYLTEILQEFVDVTDETRAGTVRPGLLQDDPTRFHISILTYSNDPDHQDRWRHSIVNHDLSTGKRNPPAYQLGGGSMWFRRFTTVLEQYWKPSTDRQRGRTLGNVVLSRAEHALNHAPINNLVDSFGEYAVQMYVKSSTATDAGGQGQFITHSKIWWEVLTARDD
jgi:hypothetical protein